MESSAVGSGPYRLMALRLNRYVEQPLPVMGVFLLFVVAWYMNWGARRGFFAAMRFELILGVFLLVACSVLLARAKLSFSRSAAVLGAGGALLVMMALSVPFAADPVQANFIFLERGVIKFSMMAFFIMVMVQSPRTLLWFLLAFLFACFYVTQESVQGLISGGLYWQNQGVMRLHGAVRMYAHPNSLAGVGMGVIPFVVFLFPVVRSWFIRAGLLAVLSTSLICVVYSGSRTAYVGIIGFLIFWWAVSPNKLRFLAASIVLVAAVYPTLPEQYRDRFKSITGQEAEGRSKDARILILRDAWEIFLENPLGVGLASFPAVREERFGRNQDTHNLYFEVATNLGIQGLMTFLVFIFVLFRTNYLSYRYYSSRLRTMDAVLRRRRLDQASRRAIGRFRGDLQLLGAVIKAVSGFVIVRLVLGLFGMDMYEIYWWFALGLTVALANMAHSVGARARMASAIGDSGLSNVRDS